jgi:hypothetical protein
MTIPSDFDTPKNPPDKEHEHSAGKVYLNVPYVDKDEAKRLGARWDDAQRKWFISQIMDFRPFSRWLPDELKQIVDQEDRAREALPAARDFKEKARQVDPNTVTAFGISLASRYGKADEIVEMINFAKLATTRNVAPYVKEAYYDSQCQCCSFTLAPSVDQFGAIAKQIRACAKKAIRQYDWFGEIDHGADWATDASQLE